MCALVDHIRNHPFYGAEKFVERLLRSSFEDTMWTADLARLVQLRPIKRLGLEKLRGLLQTCSLPEECKEWIDKVEKESIATPPWEKIINAIHALQQEFDQAAVEYGSLRVALSKETPPYKVNTNDELMDLCKAMAGMAPYEITATDRTVELNQSPENVLKAIESATMHSTGKK